MKQLVELGKVAEFINGFSFKPSDWENSGIKIIRIQNLTNSEKSYNRTTKEVPTKYIIRKGDILVSWSATLDVFEWDDEEDAFLNQHIFKVEPFENIIRKDYFKYALKYSIEEMSKFTHGSTMKHIVRKDFLKHKIPLPPIEEQHRIVKILDLAQSLIEKRKQAIAYLDDYIKAVFLDMFGDPVSNPKGWEIVKFKDICKIEKYQISPLEIKRSDYYIGLEDIEKGTGRIIKTSSANSSLLKSAKFVFKEENVLYGKLRPYLNKVALPDCDGICSTDILPITPIKNKSQKHFICYLMRSDFFVSQMMNCTVGANLPRVNSAGLQQICVYCPPIEMQNQFGERVKKTEILHQKMQSQLKALENNFQAELQRAFRQG